MLLYNIKVTPGKLWVVLSEVVDEPIKTGGWYFHLVGDKRIYVVLCRLIFFATKYDEIKEIVEFAKARGTHPAQLDLKGLFKDPYA